MDPRQLDSLVQRLASNPQDAEALNAAYQHGQTDPRGYAMFLEKVGAASADPAYAAHWFNEAATVWTASLNDAHRAARALMSAVDRDPSHEASAERLAQLYREKGDRRGVAALLERRTQGMSKLLGARPDLRPELGRLYSELARVWSEELSQPEKAMAAYKAAIEHNPEDVFAIYQVREALKAAGRWAEAIPYFEREQKLVQGDGGRSLELYRDEIEVCRSAGKLDLALRALRAARQHDAEDPVLKQQLAATVLEQIQGRAQVAPADREEATRLFLELAETYGGEHGYSYSACALECEASNDRAAQLLMFYGEQLGRDLEGAPLLAAYLRANSGGAVAPQAREVVARAVAGGQEQLLDALEPPADAAPSERLPALLEVAKGLARKARKREALAKYQEVLELEPSQPEAVEFVEHQLRQGRKFSELRDLLLRAASFPAAEHDHKVRWLEEVASLCEGQLKDLDGAIEARRQLILLDPTNDTAADQLHKILEKAERWDDLADLLERRADGADDIELKLSREKQAAHLHADKREDPLAAAEAWSRIARLTPDDPSPVQTAVDFFEVASRTDRAAELVAEALTTIREQGTRLELALKLGELRAGLGEWVAAGESFSEAAALGSSAQSWQRAEDCFVRGEAWEQAAGAVSERTALTSDPKRQAELCAVEADYLGRLGDASGVEARLEQATELDPSNDELASRLEALYEAAGRTEQIVLLLLRRADQLAEGGAASRDIRVGLRKRAAELKRDALGDREGMRECLLAIVEDVEDAEALRLLAEDADAAGEAEDAADFLGRLVAVASEDERVSLSLRQATLLAEGVGDLERAIERYRWVHKELAPGNREALTALAKLLQEVGEPADAAEALEELLSVSEEQQRLEVAQSLADLYESALDRPEDAVRALEIVHGIDAEDFEAIGRLCQLSERLERWDAFARYMRLLVEVEGDEAEVSRMTLRLSEILRENLNQPEEALEVLVEVSDLGDVACREEYVRLGDELGRGAQVASKLMEWHLEASQGSTRSEALRGAFDRFVEAKRSKDALKVAMELVRAKAVGAELAEQIEEIAVEAKDLDALSAAHDLLVRELSGPPRAEEMVRQAEVLSEVGVPAEEALTHGEQGLISVPPGDVEPLLARLVARTENEDQVIGLYERQVTRCKSPTDRLLALARAAEVAAERDAPSRAREFFDIALASGAQPEQIELLLDQARACDERTPRNMRRILAEACASGGDGARDGGRTRSFLLGRAAAIASEELAEQELAFQWLQEALISFVDADRLDQLEQLAEAVEAPERAAEVVGRALEQVFDGPLVRQLLAWRARLREDKLDDKKGAAEDLKRLYELLPGDADVAAQLEALYEALGDTEGLVQLYEDQILRSKDNASRAELAIKVARLWEEELDDPREAADAWRRVLRLKSGDEEAKEGLARAKAAMLAKPAQEVGVVLPERRSAGSPADSVPENPQEATEAPTPAAEASSKAAGDTPEATATLATEDGDEDGVSQAMAPSPVDAEPSGSADDAPAEEPSPGAEDAAADFSGSGSAAQPPEALAADDMNGRGAVPAALEATSLEARAERESPLGPGDGFEQDDISEQDDVGEDELFDARDSDPGTAQLTDGIVTDGAVEDGAVNDETAEDEVGEDELLERASKEDEGKVAFESVAADEDPPADAAGADAKAVEALEEADIDVDVDDLLDVAPEKQESPRSLPPPPPPRTSKAPQGVRLPPPPPAAAGSRPPPPLPPGASRPPLPPPLAGSRPPPPLDGSRPPPPSAVVGRGIPSPVSSGTRPLSPPEASVPPAPPGAVPRPPPPPPAKKGKALG